MSKMLYETDFSAWLQQQAEALRAKDWPALDVDNLIEELETLGRSEQHALWSHLRILLMHLLKWRYQPERRTRSWQGSITRARQQVARRLQQPSLRRELPEFIIEAHRDARRLAADETGLPLSRFPESCEWTEAELQNLDFLPQAVEEEGTEG
jgi:Domain of unknown function DUF29